MIGIELFRNAEKFVFFAFSREEQSEIDVTSGLYVLFGSGKKHSLTVITAVLFLSEISSVDYFTYFLCMTASE